MACPPLPRSRLLLQISCEPRNTKYAAPALQLTDYQFESQAAAPGLVLGYAELTTHAIDDGIAELASLIR